MLQEADRPRQAAFRRSVAGYAATVLGGVIGVIGGGILGLNTGTWLGERFTKLAELRWDTASFAFVLGTSVGGALLVVLLLCGSGLAAPGLTSLVFGALVPTIFAALVFWDLAVDPTVLLGTVLGLTLLAAVLSRAAAVRIARTRGSARRWAMAGVSAVWTLGLLVVTVRLLTLDVYRGV